MLSSAAVQEINTHLQQGDIAPALLPLESAVDVRAGELPAIEKATLAALGEHLGGDSEAARTLAEAALHSNISVRRFVRKVAIALKTDAAPLARPLRARIQRYTEETIALDYTFDPKAAALRREQADILDTSVELLRRCDLDEFLDYLGVLLVQWSNASAAEKAAKNPQQEAMQAYGEAAAAQWKIAQQRANEIFAERYARLGLDQFELQKASPRLWGEFQEVVQNDAEVLAAAPAPLPFTELTHDTTPKTLMQQSYNVTRAFANALGMGFVWQPDKKPGVGQEQIRDQLWRWLEDAICSDAPDAAARFDGFGYISASNYFRPQWLVERAIPLLARAKKAGRADNPAWGWLLSVFYSSLSRHKDQNIVWPPEITPDAVRALKTGEWADDRNLEELAKRIEAGLPQRATQSTPGEQNSDEDDDFDEELNRSLSSLLGAEAAKAVAGTRGAVPRAAANFTTLEERIEALINPPIIKQSLFLTTETAPAPRDEMLQCWRKAPGWETQESQLRELALPRLFEKLQKVREAYIAAGKRQAPVKAKLTEAIAAELTGREKKDWQRKKAEEEHFDLMAALDDVVNGIEELGGITIKPRVLELLDGPDLAHYKARHLMGMLDGLSQQASFENAELPIVRTLCEQWARYCATLQEDEDTQWKREWGRHSLARALYMAGTPEEIAEARLMVQSERIYDSGIVSVARQRSDAEIFMPLLRNILHFYDNSNADLTALWEDILTNQPEHAATVLPQMLDMLADAPDITQARPMLEKLEKMDKKAPLFAGHLELLVRCAEHTVPQIARFAFERLAHIEDAERDWSTLCEQAAEKLWSDNSGLAKEAAKFLGAAGVRDEAAATVAWSALSDALSLNALPLQEAALRAMTQIKAKQTTQIDDALRLRLEELKSEYSSRLGKLCERLLA